MPLRQRLGAKLIFSVCPTVRYSLVVPVWQRLGGAVPLDRAGRPRPAAGGGGRGLRAGQPPPSFQCDLPVALAVSRSGRQVPARYTGSRVSIMATTLTTVGPFVNEIGRESSLGRGYL